MDLIKTNNKKDNFSYVKIDGIWTREGTYDSRIIKEIKATYSWMDVEGKVVMDVGGCFGAFSVWASRQKASSIIAYEPATQNYEVLLKNSLEFPNILPINKALIDGFTDSIDFYLPKNRNNMGCASAFVKGGREKITVNSINFLQELHKYKPSVLKIDCEGGEYDILRIPLPNFVKQVTVEIHLKKIEWRNYKSTKLLKLFQGWKVHKEPVIGEKNWHTIGAWYRD